MSESGLKKALASHADKISKYVGELQDLADTDEGGEYQKELELAIGRLNTSNLWVDKVIERITRKEEAAKAEEERKKREAEAEEEDNTEE